MNNHQSAPKCPQAKRLRELSREMIDGNGDAYDDYDPTTGQTEEIANAINWLATFLEDRQLYHKRQQLKNKHLLRLAREHGLLDNDVKRVVEAELVDHILDQQPNDEDQPPQGETK